jgi:hypothetical protein
MVRGWHFSITFSIGDSGDGTNENSERATVEYWIIKKENEGEDHESVRL